MVKIAIIPIDNRPVTYSLCADIADFSSDIELFRPPKEYLGGLTEDAKTDKLLEWLEKLSEIDILVVSLDTIAYGGLIPSRRSNDTFQVINERILKLKRIIEKKKVKTYAFSSIMRISNNNYNEEEKEYWSLYGKKIFEYSYNCHKAQKDVQVSYEKANGVPSDILDDYLKTRSRNFEVNKLYLDWQKEGLFEYLIFSKDDCAQYGLNVQEAEVLGGIIKSNNLKAQIKTGADEIPLSLFSRAFTDSKKHKIKICPEFTETSETHLISKYEDVSIYNSVKGQIELCGGEISTREEADFILVVNNFKTEQGELVMDVDTEMYSGGFQSPKKPYAIADVRFANGADNNFVSAFFENEIDFNNFLGYAGWNTSANSLGSVLCSAIVKYLSSGVDMEKFKRATFIRFADDWAYQANCRAELKALTTNLDLELTNKKMSVFVEKLQKKIDFYPKSIYYRYPWVRFFEIEISLN